MKFDSDHDGYPTSKHNNKLQTLPYNLTINILPPFGTDNLIAILCPQTPTELHNLLQNSTTAPKAEQIIRHIDNCQVGGYSFVSKNSTYFKP